MLLYTFLTIADQKQRYVAKHPNVARRYLCDVNGNVYSMGYQNSNNGEPRLLRPCVAPKHLRNQGNCYQIAAGVYSVFSQHQIVKKCNKLFDDKTQETYDTETKQWSKESDIIKEEQIVEKDIPHRVYIYTKDGEYVNDFRFDSKRLALEWCTDDASEDYRYQIFQHVETLSFTIPAPIMHVNPV